MPRVGQEGPLSRGLLVQLEAAIGPLPAPVCFAGQLGPRTKTAAESEALRRLGCQVNSMTLAPEVVLAAELGLATLPVVVGHKRSGASAARLAADEVAGSLEAGKAALVALVVAFSTSVLPVPSGNLVYRCHG